MHITLRKHSFIIGLFLAISASSCVSNLSTKFGKQEFQVNSNVSDFAVSVNGQEPKAVVGKNGALKVVGANIQQVNFFKNGHQDELVTLIPNQKNKFRYIDLGAGIALVGSGLAIINTGGGSVTTILGGAATVYGASHLVNVAIPTGAFGAYAKYSSTVIPLKLYPDSTPNPKKAIIGCSSFMLNTKKRKVVGSISEFGNYKGVIRFTDSLLIDSVRMVENVNQHLIKLKLANKWTRIKKTTNSDATFSEEPTIFITADVKELSQNGLKAFDKNAMVYNATVSIEWTITIKDGKVLMKKITKGEGSRKEELFSNFNRSQELTAMDDAVRRALNELLFSAQFLDIIKQ